MCEKYCEYYCTSINVKIDELYFLVSRNGDTFQWTRVQEQLVQNLLVHLLRHSAAPERAELVLIHIELLVSRFIVVILNTSDQQNRMKTVSRLTIVILEFFIASTIFNFDN